MNFLGIGPMEFIVVAVLAFFLLGPKKMSNAGKEMGKILRELRAQRDEFTSMLMESVDLEDKPKRPPAPSTPAAPVGTVPQSGDPGEPGEEVDAPDPAGGTVAQIDEDGDGEIRTAGSKDDSSQEEVK